MLPSSEAFTDRKKHASIASAGSLPPCDRVQPRVRMDDEAQEWVEGPIPIFPTLGQERHVDAEVAHEHEGEHDEESGAEGWLGGSEHCRGHTITEDGHAVVVPFVLDSPRTKPHPSCGKCGDAPGLGPHRSRL